MYKKLTATAAIAVAATALAGLATASGAATQQGIAFSYANGSAKMTLTPLTPGSILADRGSTSWVLDAEDRPAGRRAARRQQPAGDIRRQARVAHLA